MRAFSVIDPEVFVLNDMYPASEPAVVVDAAPRISAIDVLAEDAFNVLKLKMAPASVDVVARVIPARNALEL